MQPVVCCRDGSTAGGHRRPSLPDSGHRKPSLPMFGHLDPAPGTASNAPDRLMDGSRISITKCAEYLGGSPTYVSDKPKYEKPKFEVLKPGRTRIRRQEFHTVAIGGKNVILGEFPHMAAIGWRTKTGGYKFSCGATLISDRFVLTAGHCLSNPRDSELTNVEPSIVRLGDHNILDSVMDGATPVDVPIKRTIRHPGFKPPNKYNDIALLEMATSVSFSDFIKPACLWTNPDFGEVEQAILTGWGTTVFGQNANAPVLQTVTLDLLENDQCDQLLASYRNRHWQGFQPHQLCAGVLTGGKDACQGDSGGPLQVHSQDSKYFVVGVTSFGRECAKPNLPGVYTRVSAFLDWIEQNVWPQ